ncbi:hypothetical protein [Planktothricoides sp. SR001]|uniref:hypothetical protein n=1 Tax=Planktothricoides sp. SR001 TaxID=1705388 RepID=UPI001E2BAC20|nr:hypothetical protein [Planktothricoides sp. SR001]
MTDIWLLTLYLLLSIADCRYGSQQLAIGYIALTDWLIRLFRLIQSVSKLIK